MADPALSAGALSAVPVSFAHRDVSDGVFPGLVCESECVVRGRNLVTTGGSVVCRCLRLRERDPRAHYLHWCCRRICYRWLLEVWHWSSSIEIGHIETKDLMSLSAKTCRQWFPLALVMRGRCLGLGLSLTEGSNGNSLTWPIAVLQL